MSKSNLMSSTRLLTPDLRELLAETSAPDLPVEMKDLSALIQTNSLELVAGDAKEFPGAAPGDHVLPCGGERVLIKGSTGYRFMILNAWEGFPSSGLIAAGMLVRMTRSPATRFG
jgi:hypothetical protein